MVLLNVMDPLKLLWKNIHGHHWIHWIYWFQLIQWRQVMGPIRLESTQILVVWYSNGNKKGKCQKVESMDQLKWCHRIPMVGANEYNGTIQWHSLTSSGSTEWPKKLSMPLAPIYGNDEECYFLWNCRLFLK